MNSPSDQVTLRRLAMALAASMLLHAALIWPLARSGAAGPGGSTSAGAGASTLRARLVAREVPVPGGAEAAAAAFPAPPVAATAPAGPDRARGGTAAGRKYLHSSEVDVRPRLIGDLQVAASAHVARATVRVLVNEQGGVDAVDLVSAEADDAMIRAILGAYAGARFDPGRKAGAAVAVEVQYAVEVAALPEPNAAATPPPPRSMATGR